MFVQAKACGHVDNARGVAHMPKVETAQASHIKFMEEKGTKGIHLPS
jgi:hypothetical protein